MEDLIVILGSLAVIAGLLFVGGLILGLPQDAIRNMNKKRAAENSDADVKEILERFPAEKKLSALLSDSIETKNFLTESDLNQLHELGAKIIMSYYVDYEDCIGVRRVLLTKNCYYSMNTVGTKNAEFVCLPIHYVQKNATGPLVNCSPDTVYGSQLVRKNVNVVGSAITGAMIGGGVGAVVGAVNAADRNSRGGKTAQQTTVAGYNIKPGGWFFAGIDELYVDSNLERGGSKSALIKADTFFRSYGDCQKSCMKLAEQITLLSNSKGAR